MIAMTGPAPQKIVVGQCRDSGWSYKLDPCPYEGHVERDGDGV